MSNNRVDPSVCAGVELEYCPHCDGHFEIITTDDGTFLNCDCPSSSDEGFEELDFND